MTPPVRPWWQRWDGLPPGMERRAEAQRQRRANATGWRRWLGGGTILAPVFLGSAQVFALATNARGWPVIAFRVAVLAVCLGSVTAAVVERRKTSA